MSALTLGDYRLVQPIPAFGSDHRMFLAKHREDPESQAPTYFVKAIEISTQPNQALRLAQFRHEAFLLDLFCHECIPTLHAKGDEQGVAYMVIDHIDGCSLADLLGHRKDACRPVSHAISVYLCAQIASALHHVHRFEYRDGENNERELQVLHRDITPANVLVSRYGDVYLIDFGSAHSPYLPAELASIEPGSMAYKAPERLTVHGRSSVQSDLFSLAVMLWESLRGERCFAGSSPTQIAEAIMSFDLQKKERKVPGLSSKLSEVLRKNLDRAPERRFPSAFHVLSRLAQTPEAEQAALAKSQVSQMVCAQLDGTPMPTQAYP